MRRGTLKVARGIKRRVGARPTLSIDANDAERLPRLLFRPTTGSWSVQHANRWYEPHRETDLDALLTMLPVEVLDDQIVASVGSPGGLVQVVDVDGVPTMEFLTSFGELVRRVGNKVPGFSRATAIWETGSHSDGWVETSAALKLDGVRKCTMVAFLPGGDEEHDLHDKELAVMSTNGRRTVVDVHRLVRGERTTVELFNSRSQARGSIVTLQSSSAEPVDDDRPLGFVCVSMEALA